MLKLNGNNMEAQLDALAKAAIASPLFGSRLNKTFPLPLFNISGSNYSRRQWKP
ncbi:hypothetical protein NG791_07070 [Laspinema sp. D1]|uniref:hypothetical protein n=1 Tax=Laspinema palackyanum TaxID=3231601 RepID=UPI00349040C2|nr:hypothetical protein [Laspinema sp. D2b]